MSWQILGSSEFFESEEDIREGWGFCGSGGGNGIGIGLGWGECIPPFPYFLEERCGGIGFGHGRAGDDTNGKGRAEGGGFGNGCGYD